MTDYVFFLWNKDGILRWQMLITTDDPERYQERLVDIYNKANDWPLESEEAATRVTFSKLPNWLSTLYNRGDQYVKLIDEGEDHGS